MAYELIKEQLLQELKTALEHSPLGVAIFVAPFNKIPLVKRQGCAAIDISDQCASVISLVPDGDRALTIKIIKSRHSNSQIQFTESEI